MAKIDFKNTGFIIVKPPSKIVSQHKLKNNVEYEALVAKAIADGYCLYSATIIRRDSKYIAIQPWCLIEETLPQLEVEEVVPPPEESDELRCDVCRKKFSSRSGLTLHMKAKHS